MLNRIVRVKCYKYIYIKKNHLVLFFMNWLFKVFLYREQLRIFIDELHVLDQQNQIQGPYFYNTANFNIYL